MRKAESGKADPNVTAWAAGFPGNLMFLPAISVLELETGVLLLSGVPRLSSGGDTLSLVG
ncbi:hypothetical protein [Nitrosomonas mobilis]|uniref:Uncharacterized protein n=1 Tax=Nitrosomonas mobilis TaxID=51642 RepID=A0A1G5SCA9_9PROT|nr:hypothetical protein [Nitrosomonas mobilis]SCZ84782.1 hypothetical protein NSMM_260078 [Nitrosomonas mobilis]